jgi:hypothetical protein
MKHPNGAVAEPIASLYVEFQFLLRSCMMSWDERFAEPIVLDDGSTVFDPSRKDTKCGRRSLARDR